MISQEAIDKIILRCRYRFDSCGIRDGVAYRVENKKPTHLAFDGLIYKFSPDELVKIGSYTGNRYAARKALENL